MSRMHLQHRRSLQVKNKKPAALNLVSLMDIFTILVFFLMVNSSEVEVLETSAKIKLPDSTSEQRPETQLVISISDDDVVVQGRRVARVSDAMSSGERLIDGLQQELAYQAERKGEVPEAGHEVTIMGDRDLPYLLLKKIMLTCQNAHFSRISLAVNRVGAAGDQPAGLPAGGAPQVGPDTVAIDSARRGA